MKFVLLPPNLIPFAQVAAGYVCFVTGIVGGMHALEWFSECKSGKKQWPKFPNLLKWATPPVWTKFPEFKQHATIREALEADVAAVGQDFRTIGNDFRTVIKDLDGLIETYKEEGDKNVAYEKFCELCENLTASGMFKKPTVPCSREEFEQAMEKHHG